MILLTFGGKMSFKLQGLALFLMVQGCIKGSGTKGDFRANVQDNRTINQLAPDNLPDQYFEIELAKEKEKLKEVTLRSTHKDEIKEQAIAYIDNFDYSQINNMKDFMDIFLTDLMRILPDGLKETLDVAVDSTIIAANTPVSKDDDNINSLKQRILKEVIRKTAVQKSISEADIKTVIAEAVQESGYWQGENVEEIIARVNEEILSEPEIVEALSQKAMKQTMDGCVDPDLSTLLSTSTITLCDGTQTTGTLTLPGECDAAGQTDCLAQGDFKTINSATCTNPDLSKISTSETVILCDGSTATGSMSTCSTPGESNCIATATFPSMDLTSKDASGAIDLLSSTFETTIISGNLFEYWDETGKRHTSSGDSDITASKIKSSVEVFGITGGYNGPPLRPTGIDSVPQLSPAQINFSWYDQGVAGYLLIVREGSAVSFVPADGTSYTASVQGLDEIIYVGANTSFLQSTGLSQNNTYHYALYAYDAYYHYSPALVFTNTAFSCEGLPGGDWVYVPGDSDYAAQDFCVMKYEAKNNGSDVPESKPEDFPWVSINQIDSQSECQSLGTGFDLISNDQWMTLATNIANNPANWSNGQVGNGHLNRGHSDNNPSNACPASTLNDTDAWVEGDCTPEASGGDENDPSRQKRTHALSNGEIIWDVAGNISEWTSVNGWTNKPITGVWNQYTEPAIDYSSASMTETDLIPQIAIDNLWNSTQGIGEIWAGIQGNGGALHRGSRYIDRGGIFSAIFNTSSGTNNPEIGFRCVADAP